MMYYLRTHRIFHVLHGVLLAAFLGTSVLPGPALAQMAVPLPPPGATVTMSPAFQPACLKGLKIDPRHPFHFDFLVDPGQGSGDQPVLKDTTQDLVKYFLTALTVPQSDLWVNLSPLEPDRITPKAFGPTTMARDLLAQDYLLKQLTSSLMDPDTALGRTYWDLLYKTLAERFGTTDVPLDTFHKIWITPDRARVYANGTTVVILESHLKVMLEEDYIAMSHQRGIAESSAPASDLTTRAMREVLLPKIEAEINTGKNFALLRQVFHAMILAKWFKDHLRQSLLGKAYVDQSATSGVEQPGKDGNEQIYQQYIAAYRKGVINMIREEPDPATGEVLPRKYFTGGVDAAGLTLVEDNDPAPVKAALTGRPMLLAACDMAEEHYRWNDVKDQVTAIFSGQKDEAYFLSLSEKIANTNLLTTYVLTTHGFPLLLKLDKPWLQVHEEELLLLLKTVSGQEGGDTYGSYEALKIINNMYDHLGTDQVSRQKEFEKLWPGLYKMGLAGKGSLIDFIKYNEKNITDYNDPKSRYPKLSLFVLKNILGQDFDRLWLKFVKVFVAMMQDHNSLFFKVDAWQLHQLKHTIPVDANLKKLFEAILDALDPLGESYFRIIQGISSAMPEEFYTGFLTIALNLKTSLMANNSNPPRFFTRIKNKLWDLADAAVDAGVFSPEDARLFTPLILDKWVRFSATHTMSEFLARMDEDTNNIKHLFDATKGLEINKLNGLPELITEVCLDGDVQPIKDLTQLLTHKKFRQILLPKTPNTIPVIMDQTIAADMRFKIMHSVGAIAYLANLMQGSLQDERPAFDAVFVATDRILAQPVNAGTPEAVDALMPGLRRSIIENIFKAPLPANLGTMLTDDPADEFYKNVTNIASNILTLGKALNNYMIVNDDNRKLFQKIFLNLAQHAAGHTLSTYAIYIDQQVRPIKELLQTASQRNKPDLRKNYQHINDQRRIESAVRDTILSGKPLYMQRLQQFIDRLHSWGYRTTELLSEKTLALLDDPSIDLRYKMDALPFVTEVMLMKEAYGSYNDRSKIIFKASPHDPQLPPDLKAGRAIEAASVTLIRLWHKILQTSATSRNADTRKALAQISRQMPVLRATLLESLIQEPVPENATPLFENTSFINQIGTIMSVFTKSGEDSRLWSLYRYAIKEFLNAYHKNAGVSAASRALRTKLMAIGKDSFKIHPDLEMQREFKDLVFGNKEAVARLVGNGWDPRLWEEGIELDWSLSKGMSDVQIREQIRHSATAMVESVEASVKKLEWREFKFRDMPVSVSNTVKLIQTTKDAEEFRGAFIKFNTAPELNNNQDHKNTLSELQSKINEIDALEKAITSQNGKQNVKITFRKDLLEEASVGQGAGQGCFSSEGVQKITPLETALQATAGFIIVHDQDGRQLATAHVALGDEGAYIDPIYTGSAYDMEPAFAAAIAELSRYLPKDGRIMLTPGSAAYNFFMNDHELKKIRMSHGTTGTIQLHRPETIIERTYFDAAPNVEHIPVDKESYDMLDVQTFTVNAADTFTNADLQTSGIFQLLANKDFQERRAILKPEIGKSLFNYLKENHPGYIPMIQFISQVFAPQYELRMTPENYAAFIEHAIDRKIISNTPAGKEKAEKSFDDIADYFEKELSLKVVDMTPDHAMPATVDKAATPGGIDMNPDLLKLDTTGHAVPMAPADNRMAPGKITGLTPVITSLTPLVSAAQFLE